MTSTAKPSDFTTSFATSAVSGKNSDNGGVRATLFLLREESLIEGCTVFAKAAAFLEHQHQRLVVRGPVPTFDLCQPIANFDFAGCRTGGSKPIFYEKYAYHNGQQNHGRVSNKLKFGLHLSRLTSWPGVYSRPVKLPM
jgi:hypothetical protein